MSRTAPDDDVPLPPHGRPPAMEARRPCRRCKDDTLTSTLSQYGGMCWRCYGAHCSEPQPNIDAGDRRVSSRDWAHALRHREEAKAPLTAAQRVMWRAALPVEAAFAGVQP